MSGSLRFGVQVSGGGTAVEWAETARRAEGQGYSTFSMADHFDSAFALVPALMAAADATTELRIAAMVFANDFRHPAVLARDAATLDLLSDGRLELGMGAGWQTTDYEQSGLELDSPGIRIARLAEAVTVVKGLMAPGRFDFDGVHYQISGLDAQPKPLQNPHPPLLIGGGGERILSLAGREADIVGLNPTLPAGVIDHRAGPDATAAATHRKIGWVRAAAGTRFDEIELQSRIHLAMITDNVAGFAAVLAPTLGLSPSDALESPHALGGTVEAVVERILAIHEIFGISYLTWSEASMEAMAPVVDRLGR